MFEIVSSAEEFESFCNLRRDMSELTTLIVDVGNVAMSQYFQIEARLSALAILANFSQVSPFFLLVDEPNEKT